MSLVDHLHSVHENISVRQNSELEVILKKSFDAMQVRTEMVKLMRTFAEERRTSLSVGTDNGTQRKEEEFHLQLKTLYDQMFERFTELENLLRDSKMDNIQGIEKEISSFLRQFPDGEKFNLQDGEKLKLRELTASSGNEEENQPWKDQYFDCFYKHMWRDEKIVNMKESDFLELHPVFLTMRILDSRFGGNPSFINEIYEISQQVDRHVLKDKKLRSRLIDDALRSHHVKLGFLEKRNLQRIVGQMLRNSTEFEVRNCIEKYLLEAPKRIDPIGRKQEHTDKKRSSHWLLSKIKRYKAFLIALPIALGALAIALKKNGPISRIPHEENKYGYNDVYTQQYAKERLKEYIEDDNGRIMLADTQYGAYFIEPIFHKNASSLFYQALRIPLYRDLITGVEHANIDTSYILSRANGVSFESEHLEAVTHNHPSGFLEYQNILYKVVCDTIGSYRQNDDMVMRYTRFHIQQLFYTERGSGKDYSFNRIKLDHVNSNTLVTGPAQSGEYMETYEEFKRRAEFSKDLEFFHIQWLEQTKEFWAKFPRDFQGGYVFGEGSSQIIISQEEYESMLQGIIKLDIREIEKILQPINFSCIGTNFDNIYSVPLNSPSTSRGVSGLFSRYSNADADIYIDYKTKNLRDVLVHEIMHSYLYNGGFKYWETEGGAEFWAQEFMYDALGRDNFDPAALYSEPLLIYYLNEYFKSGLERELIDTKRGEYVKNIMGKKLTSNISVDLFIYSLSSFDLKNLRFELTKGDSINKKTHSLQYFKDADKKLPLRLTPKAKEYLISRLNTFHATSLGKLQQAGLLWTEEKLELDSLLSQYVSEVAIPEINITPSINSIMEQVDKAKTIDSAIILEVVKAVFEQLNHALPEESFKSLMLAILVLIGSVLTKRIVSRITEKEIAEIVANLKKEKKLSDEEKILLHERLQNKSLANQLIGGSVGRGMLFGGLVYGGAAANILLGNQSMATSFLNYSPQLFAVTYAILTASKLYKRISKQRTYIRELYVLVGDIRRGETLEEIAVTTKRVSELLRERLSEKPTSRRKNWSTQVEKRNRMNFNTVSRQAFGKNSLQKQKNILFIQALSENIYSDSPLAKNLPKIFNIKDSLAQWDREDVPSIVWGQGVDKKDIDMRTSERIQNGKVAVWKVREMKQEKASLFIGYNFDFKSLEVYSEKDRLGKRIKKKDTLQTKKIISAVCEELAKLRAILVYGSSLIQKEKRRAQLAVFHEGLPLCTFQLERLNKKMIDAKIEELYDVFFKNFSTFLFRTEQDIPPNVIKDLIRRIHPKKVVSIGFRGVQLNLNWHDPRVAHNNSTRAYDFVQLSSSDVRL